MFWRGLSRPVPPTERRRVRCTAETHDVLVSAIEAVDAEVIENVLGLMKLYRDLGKKCVDMGLDELVIDARDARMLALVIGEGVAVGVVGERAAQRALWAIAQAEPA